MHKCELKFIISYLKKAIFNIERARGFEESSVSDAVLNELKEQLLYYKLKLEEEEENEK
jgi:hypothetical protein